MCDSTIRGSSSSIFLKRRDVSERLLRAVLAKDAELFNNACFARSNQPIIMASSLPECWIKPPLSIVSNYCAMRQPIRHALMLRADAYRRRAFAQQAYVSPLGGLT
jgi:hypothetical protein